MSCSTIRLCWFCPKHGEIPSLALAHISVLFPCRWSPVCPDYLESGHGSERNGGNFTRQEIPPVSKCNKCSSYILGAGLLLASSNPDLQSTEPNMNALILCTVISSSLAQPSDRVNGLFTRIPNACSTNTGSTCVFPFTYKGVEHYQCTYADSPTPWCATQVDSEGVVVTNR